MLDIKTVSQMAYKGELGLGRPLGIITKEGSMRFTHALALGSGYFPEPAIVKEEHLEGEDQRRFMIMEVGGVCPNPSSVEYLLARAVECEFYKEAMEAAKGLGGAYEVGLVRNFHGKVVKTWSWRHEETEHHQAEDVIYGVCMGEGGELGLVARQWEYPIQSCVRCLNDLYPYDIEVIPDETGGTVVGTKGPVRSASLEEMLLIRRAVGF